MFCRISEHKDPKWALGARRMNGCEGTKKSVGRVAKILGIRECAMLRYWFEVSPGCNVKRREEGRQGGDE